MKRRAENYIPTGRQSGYSLSREEMECTNTCEINTSFTGEGQLCQRVDGNSSPELPDGLTLGQPDWVQPAEVYPLHILQVPDIAATFVIADLYLLKPPWGCLHSGRQRFSNGSTKPHP